MSLIVGVTGGIGSGKSALTTCLAAYGVTVVDADLIAREVVAKGSDALNAIVRHFGEQVLLADGTLNRAVLRKIVFADASQRRWLEQLTHPLINTTIRGQLAASSSAYTVLSSPLLLEGSQAELVQCIVVVDVPVKIQMERTIARDNNDKAQVERIIATQIDRKSRLAKADIVIDNSGSLSALHQQAKKLHQQLLLMAANNKNL
ncbi:MAG: dephospho-CoA kinase [Parahaliea sp.]